MKFLYKYILRFLLAVSFHFLFKLYDQTFDGMFDFGVKGVLFLVYFVLFFFSYWGVGVQLYRKTVRYNSSVNFFKQFGILSVVYLLYGVFTTLSLSFTYYWFDFLLFDLAHYGAPGIYFDFDSNLGMFVAYCTLLLFLGQAYVYGHLRESKHLADRLMKENIQTRYEALKNQMDPHFFFNSLSVLSSLVYQSADLSAEYITRLSKLYRYILDHKDDVIVPLNEELEMLQSYIFLMKIRHDSSIDFKIDLADEIAEKDFVPPGTFQILAENAIKHNKHTSEEPLLVEIFELKKEICFRNNLNEKNVLEKGTGIGLSNLSKQFDLLGATKIRIDKSDEYFSVFVPKLSFESIRPEIQRTI